MTANAVLNVKARSFRAALLRRPCRRRSAQSVTGKESSRQNSISRNLAGHEGTDGAGTGEMRRCEDAFSN